MRFAVARQQGLDETKVEQIDDGYPQSGLPKRLKLALAFADSFFAAEPPPPALQQALVIEFGSDALVEMAIGLALFHGVSKLLITLGCEPEQMGITELRTPGS